MPYKEREISKKYYSIGEVAEKLDLNTSLIRFWESEFEILNPKKINDKIKPTNDFNILWKKLIKIRQLYVSDVMPKKWYTVDNLDNLKKLKKIFK